MKTDFRLMLISVLLYTLIVTVAVGFVGKASADEIVNITKCTYDKQTTHVKNVTKDGFDIQSSDTRTHCKPVKGK